MPKRQKVTRSYSAKSRLVALAFAFLSIAALTMGSLQFVDAQAASAKSTKQANTSCKAEPKQKKLLDQEPTEEPLKPWKADGGKELVIYYETKSLPAEYKTYVRKAAKIWSVSACIEAKAIEKCPSKSKCIPMKYKKEDTEEEETTWRGTFFPKEKGDYLVGGRIEFYWITLGKLDKTFRQGTVLHEMGHALGLEHRRKGSLSLMDPARPRNIITKPDSTEWQNLRFLYGKR